MDNAKPAESGTSMVEELKFEQSDIDVYVCYRCEVIYLLYTDDSILANKDESQIQQTINDIKTSGLKLRYAG